MKLLVLADSIVGEKIVRFLIENYVNEIGLIVALSDNNIIKMAKKAKIRYAIYDNNSDVANQCNNISIKLGILAWWPNIIKEPLLSFPRNGFINTHPSYLPYNRGKHYNFWALVEQVPFGVTIHTIDSSIDKGSILAQREIPYTWEDTGETLFFKAQKEMVHLFIEAFDDILLKKIKPVMPDYGEGSFHHSKELDPMSEIDLEKQFTARELLNLLRARTFKGYPACYFFDQNTKYEVRVNIRRCDNE